LSPATTNDAALSTSFWTSNVYNSEILHTLSRLKLFRWLPFSTSAVLVCYCRCAIAPLVLAVLLGDGWESSWCLEECCIAPVELAASMKNLVTTPAIDKNIYSNDVEKGWYNLERSLWWWSIRCKKCLTRKLLSNLLFPIMTDFNIFAMNMLWHPSGTFMISFNQDDEMRTK
jgi:hypothetical protein